MNIPRRQRTGTGELLPVPTGNRSSKTGGLGLQRLIDALSEGAWDGKRRNCSAFPQAQPSMSDVDQWPAAILFATLFILAYSYVLDISWTWTFVWWMIISALFCLVPYAGVSLYGVGRLHCGKDNYRWFLILGVVAYSLIMIPFAPWVNESLWDKAMANQDAHNILNFAQPTNIVDWLAGHNVSEPSRATAVEETFSGRTKVGWIVEALLFFAVAVIYFPFVWGDEFQAWRRERASAPSGQGGSGGNDSTWRHFGLFHLVDKLLDHAAWPLINKFFDGLRRRLGLGGN